MMTAHRLPGPGQALLVQIRYQLQLLLRTPRAVVAGIVLPALLLLVSHPSHGPIATARLAGLVVLGVTITAWSTNGISLVTAREAGVLKRWRATPMPAWCYFAGRVIAMLILGTLSGAVTVAVSVWICHTHLSLPIALGVLAGLALGALAGHAGRLPAGRAADQRHHPGAGVLGGPGPALRARRDRAGLLAGRRARWLIPGDVRA
jgi:ABC-2 type transport system permease protein